MAATWRDVQVTLGRTFDTAQILQVSAWIEQARIIIGARATREGTTLDALDQTILDMVVTEAVAARVKKPDDATQVQVQVDEASVNRTYESSTGQIEILVQWWELLFPATTPVAFSIGFSA